MHISTCVYWDQTHKDEYMRCNISTDKFFQVPSYYPGRLPECDNHGAECGDGRDTESVSLHHTKVTSRRSRGTPSSIAQRSMSIPNPTTPKALGRGGVLRNRALTQGARRVGQIRRVRRDWRAGSIKHTLGSDSDVCDGVADGGVTRGAASSIVGLLV